MYRSVILTDNLSIDILKSLKVCVLEFEVSRIVSTSFFNIVLAGGVWYCSLGPSF